MLDRTDAPPSAGGGDPPAGPPLTILVNAGPWLAVPPRGYGGIENVVATLVSELRRAGHRVVLATVGESRVEADGRVCAFATGQFARLGGSYGETVGITHAHMHALSHALRDDPTIDIVHDHLEVVGPAMLAALGPASPPTLQTLHWDLRKHARFYETFDGAGRVWFAAVSASQLSTAPANLVRHTLGVVPLAAPGPAADPVPAADHFLTLGRLTRVKGFDLAARACRRLGARLVMAGPVAGLADRRALDAVLADPDDPARNYADVRYFLDVVAPLVDGRCVEWVGAVDGHRKEALLRTARAVVFPLRWDEPGGTAIVEALLAGVPVVGMRRGVLPSLVEHGVTGFVVDTEDDLVDSLRRVDELDRKAIARRVRGRFTPAGMAAAYVELYREVIERARATSTITASVPTGGRGRATGRPALS